MVAQPSTELIGRRLQQRRQERRLSVDQAATALHIRIRYVEAMENGNFDCFPSPAQARGFLRSYAQYLDLEAAPFLAALEGDTSLLEDVDQDQNLAEGPAIEDETVENEGFLTGQDTGVTTPPGDEGEAQAASRADGTSRLETPPRRRKGRPTEGQPARLPRTKFVEIGQKLRAQREALGLSLDDIESHTRLRAFYLKALEAGDLDGLPSPVQGRGMLKNYASFLGMDTDGLLLSFAEGLQERLAERRKPLLRRRGRATAGAAPMGSPQPRLITTDLVVAGVLILFLVAFMAWGVIRITAMRSGQAPTATALAISDVLAQIGTPTNAYSVELTAQPSPTGQQAVAPPPTDTPAPEAVTPPANFGSAAVQVIISVRMRAWMRVTVDGKVAFDGRVLPGSAFPFAGDQAVEILTGNAAGLDVNFTQTDMGPLGTLGQAVQRVFTVQGMQTPTPTITHTPAPATDTPTITPTP